MKKEIEQPFYDEALFFKALAHPTRLFIIDAIREKERSVKELAEMVNVDISTMSKHLDILKKKRIIEGTKVRNFVYYRLAIPCVLDFMQCALKLKKKN